MIIIARGSIAKENVAKVLAESFGKDWIGESDKKYYVWANDGGERVQIAISLTCPKNPVGAAVSPTSNEINFEAEPERPVMEITPDEQEMIDKLKAELGL